MNLSEIVVPEFEGLTVLFVVLFGCTGAAAMAALLGFLGTVSPRSRSTKVRLSILCGVVALGIASAGATYVMGEDAGNRQDRNFARALSERYGATSSVPYSKLMDRRAPVPELTRDGKSTPVRFVEKDGKLTPFVLSDDEYPALPGK